jgi:Lon-like protease
VTSSAGDSSGSPSDDRAGRGLLRRLPGLSRLTPRHRTLLVCAVPFVALLVVAASAPLPFALAQPGVTADVLGKNRGKAVVTITKGAGEGAGEGGGAASGRDSGKLLMTTIAATPPGTTVRLPDVAQAWFETKRAAMPVSAVYPGGGDTKQVEKHNRSEMKRSQDDAVKAALHRLHRSPDDVAVRLRLADVGGPSAGLLFSLGIVDKLDGGGTGGLTGGRTIAGTGTIDAHGEVGAVGGVPLKTQAAKRDGARFFLVPKAECAEAQAELPKGMRLIPVTSLDDALASLKSLRKGGHVPRC